MAASYSTNSPIHFGSTLDTGICYTSTSAWMVSSDPPTSWMGSSDDFGEFVDDEPEPTIKIEFCQWCSAEYYANTFRPGTCIGCGGPKNVK